MAKKPPQPQCKPPAGTAPRTRHILVKGWERASFIWDGKLWATDANPNLKSYPDQMARWGWSYMGPAL